MILTASIEERALNGAPAHTFMIKFTHLKTSPLPILTYARHFSATTTSCDTGHLNI